MKPSLSYLEKGRNTILNLGYGIIERRSRIKKCVKKKVKFFLKKNQKSPKNLRKSYD